VIYFLLAILGLLLGSFASMASYRLPISKSLFGRSRCTQCKNKLGVLDLIPIFSFIFNGAKCKYCSRKISYRYLLIEISTSLIFVINGVIFKDNLFLLILSCLASVILVIITVSDLENYIIPDQAVFALGLIGVFFAFFSFYPLIQVIFMPIFVLLLALLLRRCSTFFFGREALGMGDVKFFLASSFYLDAENLSTFFILSGIIALCTGVIWRITGRGDYFPFAPALSCSLYICISGMLNNVVGNIIN
jgi:leader peptidase (prepilin peptidase) / N-methyltransferase